MKLLNEIVNSKIRIIQETQSNSLKKSNAKQEKIVLHCQK
jgi:hypothetical protein